MAKSYRVAVIAGDGIGHEVMPEGIAAMERAAGTYGFELRLERVRLELRALCQDRADDARGRARPAAALRRRLSRRGRPSRGARPCLAVGPADPAAPRLSPIRQPAPGAAAGRGRSRRCATARPGDIDFYVVRENNEGEYSAIGGRLYDGTEHEMAMQQSVFTRRGCDRIMRYAFELARTRKKHVTSATKSNGIIHTMPYWDERFAAIAKRLPRRQDRPVPHRHPDRAFRAPSGLVRRRRRLESVRRHPVRSRARPWSARSASRPRATSTPSANIPRCSSRCTARRPTSPGGHRQPDRPDLVGRDDARRISARTPRPQRSSARSPRCWPMAAPAPPISAATPAPRSSAPRSPPRSADAQARFGKPAISIRNTAVPKPPQTVDDRSDQEPRKAEAVAERQALERRHDEPREDGRKYRAENDRTDPIAAGAASDRAFGQHKDDTPYPAPKGERDKLRHVERRHRTHVVGHGPGSSRQSAATIARSGETPRSR